MSACALSYASVNSLTSPSKQATNITAKSNLPAAGSTTRLSRTCHHPAVAKQLEADGALRLCPDEWLTALGFDIYDHDARVRVEAVQWELAQALALRGLTVVDECGVWQRWERDLRREWAREHGVVVELRFLDASVDVLTARVAERNRALPEGAPRIDPALVALWDARIDRPDADEMALFDRQAGVFPGRHADADTSSTSARNTPTPSRMCWPGEKPLANCRA